MKRRRWQRHWRRWALAGLCATGCAAPPQQATRPRFGPPQHGVFYDPVPMVASTEDDLLPTLSGSGGVIAYAGRVGGNLDIYTRPLAGGAPVRLTSHSTDDTDPAFAPNGAQLAWISQADDVKGDVWVMDADGGGKRRLSDRRTSDQAPFWSPDGRRVFFTCRAPGSPLRRIDAVSVGTPASQGARQTVVAQGWDGTLSPDGSVLFYVNFDAQQRPRVFARRLADGAEVPLTDGVFIEATPRAALAPDGSTLVVFARFMDDLNDDGVLDVDDAPSLWSMAFSAERFAGAAAPAPRPLTAGEGGEIFASTLHDWLVYTAAGRGDLEIFALPLHGVIAPEAPAATVLEAGRAASLPALRRLALRSVVATSPELAGPAHYELARELAERGKLVEAMAELERAQGLAGDSALGWVAALEHTRLQVLAQLHNRLLVREAGERQAVLQAQRAVQALAAAHPEHAAAQARALGIQAELAYALGQRGPAVDAFEALLRRPDLPDEDGARALARLGEAYSGLGDLAAVARVCEASLRRFPKERFAAQHAAERWVQAAQEHVSGAPAAALEAIVSAQHDLPGVAARAAAALARWQRSHGQEAVALQSWKRIAEQFTGEREVLVEALLAIGDSAVAAGEQEAALGAYERLLAEFPEVPALRAQARRGLTALALREARQAERRGHAQEARQAYSRLLHSNPEMVLALRRTLALSAQLGELPPLLRAYGDAAARAPRDKLARYAYGYALSLQSPPDLRGAQREMEAVLGLEPRFAAAQLTLGWIRLMREPTEPGQGWLEQAAESFETARGLVDAHADPELWAAATLNKGNALFALGKLDDAFSTYLERELADAPFETPVSEVLFRESFSRVALRVGQLDVALDMAYGAQRLSQGLPNTPRASALAALLGALNLQSERYADALHHYDDAVARYAQVGDWPHVVPMLRGRALALRTLGRDPEALAALQRLLEILAQGHGPPPPPEGTFITEIAANAQNITAGVYGFEQLQEEDIARATAARIFRARVDYDSAKRFDAQHLELLRRLASDKRQGPRVRLELLYALHENAVTAAGAGDAPRALALWAEALPMAAGDGHWTEAATLAESLLALELTHPERRDPVLAAQVALTSQNGLAASAADPALQKRFARLTALVEARAALQPLKPASPGLGGLLQALEGTVLVHVRPALRAAAQSGDAALQAHLAHWLGGAPPAAPAPEPRTWRQAFDRGLWDGPQDQAPNPAWLDKAWQLYAASRPTPNAPPEQPAFVDAVVRRLAQTGSTEQAWAFLEQSRLRGLQPSPERVGREEVARAWAALRASHDTPGYAAALQSAPALLRALEAAPAPLAQVRVALEGEATLLQAFAPNPQVWHWFIVDAQRLVHVETPPPGDTLPEPVRQALGPWPATLYVDTGSQLAMPAWRLQSGGAPLGQQVAVSEALSATYLVAAYEARNLARDKPLTITSQDPEALRRASPARGLFHLALPGRFSGPALGTTGTTQVVFGQVDAGAVIDLTVLQGLSRDDSLALVDGLPPSARVARAVAQSLLIAGIPSAWVGDGGGAPAAAVLGADGAERVAMARPQAPPPGMRLVGYRGMSAAAQTQFAADEVLRLTKLGIAAFKTGRETQDPAAWRRARDLFLRILDTLAYMDTPAVRQRLSQGSKDQQRFATPQSVTNARLGNQSVLAETYAGLKELGLATKVREAILATQLQVGKPPAIYDALLKLGQTLRTSGLPRDAAQRFQACVDLAHGHQDSAPEAACQMALADARREQFDYAGAQQALEAAIALQTATPSVAQIVPRRQLGILFESQLNNYDKAQAQFGQALDAARALGAPDMVPRLLIDLSRVSRVRGDYAQALGFVDQARALLTKAPAGDRAAAALEAAKIHWYRGAYPRARSLNDEALALCHQAGDLFSEIQARSLRGLIALNQGELAQAESAIREALDLSRSIGRRSEEAAQLNNLGTVQREAGRLDDAVASFRGALRIDEALGSAEGRAYDLRNLAVAYARQSQLPEALAAVSQALDLSRTIGNRYNELQCLFAEGEMRESDAQDRATAQARYQDAAKLARDIAVPEVEWRALYALGRLASADSTPASLSDARALYDQALAVAEHLGRGRQESGGAGAAHGRDDLYVDAAALAVAQDDLPRAHAIAERGRQRSLVDLLASRAFDLPTAARALLDAEGQSHEALLIAQRAVSRGQGDSATVAAAEARHSAAQAALQAQAPRLARAVSLQPVPLQALQSALPPRTTVLSFLVGGQQTVVLDIRSAAVHAHVLPVGAAALRSTIHALHAQLRGFAPTEAPLQALAEALLAPLRADALAAPNLVLVPHGPLFRVPFAALPSGDGPVWQRHALTTALTAGHLRDALALPALGAPKSVTALAPSRDLAFAALEARAVADDGLWLGSDATTARLRAARTDALDIAAHGELSPGDPLGSALLLAPTAADSGRLEVRELFGWEGLPPLVTLSACDTAYAGGASGAEWLGLGQGFLMAGARQVVASQHRVSDLAAGLLMKHFYRGVRHMPPAQALQQAAMVVRHTYPHPAHWAGFVLLGDPR